MKYSRDDEWLFHSHVKCCECGKSLSRDIDRYYFEVDGLVLCEDCVEEYVCRNFSICGMDIDTEGLKCMKCGEQIFNYNGYMIGDDCVCEDCLTDYLYEYYRRNL